MFPSAMDHSVQDPSGQGKVPAPSHPRIGVFICHCGHNIAGYLDIATLLESARDLPYVVHTQASQFACSDAGLADIRTAIASHSLNRVVVASCTPRTHEPLFQATCQEAGLNRYLFEFVNIRDQCSWVHMDDGARATKKAAALIRMGVAKAALLEPLAEIELKVQPAAVVIGGGMAGMTASLSLAHRGFPVTLVERTAQLGGILRRLDKLYPTNSNASDLVESTWARVTEEPNIEVLTSATVRQVSGHIGNYELTIESAERATTTSVKAGVIIVATGAREYQPIGQYGYGDNPRVVTQGLLEHLLRSGDRLLDPSSLGTVVMIQCVGARDEVRPYCGRICCMTAIKNAVMLKRHNPQTEVYLLYRDVEVHGVQFEDYYARAREAGVVFARYSPEIHPQVTDEHVIVHDELLGAYFAIPYDLVVLSTPLVPHSDSPNLAQALKVPVDEYGFFLEAHVKLRPLDFATDGIYLCGSAHWPAHLDETISQALGAAARAATVLSKDLIRSSGATACVDEQLCRGCERCIQACEFGAISLVELERHTDHRLYAIPAPRRSVAVVNQVLCKGCGACAVICPTGAMKASHFTSNQVVAMVQAALGG